MFGAHLMSVYNLKKKGREKDSDIIN